MSSISFNTDKTTKQKAAILAAFKGVKLDEIIKEAVKLYIDSIEDELRPVANTVDLDAKSRERLRKVQERTRFSKSKIIHLCLVKYVEANIKANKKKLAHILSEQVA